MGYMQQCTITALIMFFGHFKSDRVDAQMQICLGLSNATLPAGSQL